MRSISDIEKDIRTGKSVPEEEVLELLNKKFYLCFDERFVSKLEKTPKIYEKILNVIKFKYGHQYWVKIDPEIENKIIMNQFIDYYEDLPENVIKGLIEFKNLSQLTKEELVKQIITHGDFDKYYDTLVANFRKDDLYEGIKYGIKFANQKIRESIILKNLNTYYELIPYLKDPTKIKNAFSQLDDDKKYATLLSIEKSIKNHSSKDKGKFLLLAMYALRDKNKKVSDKAKKIIQLLKV